MWGTVSHHILSMSVWAHKPVAVYTSFTELNTPSVSLSLSTEEPKLVQRKSHLVFIHFINTCDSVSPLWVYMCADFSSRHVGDPWKSLGVVLETSVAHEMKGCCPWPCLLEHQITYVGYWSSRQEWRGLKRATGSPLLMKRITGIIYKNVLYLQFYITPQDGVLTQFLTPL